MDHLEIWSSKFACSLQHDSLSSIHWIFHSIALKYTFLTSRKRANDFGVDDGSEMGSRRAFAHYFYQVAQVFWHFVFSQIFNSRMSVRLFMNYSLIEHLFRHQKSFSDRTTDARTGNSMHPRRNGVRFFCPIRFPNQNVRINNSKLFSTHKHPFLQDNREDKNWCGRKLRLSWKVKNTKFLAHRR